ncbi:MAG: ABC transporter substrate-binding protein [Pseudomonadota bacterium]
MSTPIIPSHPPRLDDHLDKMFGRTRRRIDTGPHVEVWREVENTGERYFRKHFKKPDDGAQDDLSFWTVREFSLASSLWRRTTSVHTQRVKSLANELAGGQELQTFDAGPTLEQWLDLPVVGAAGVLPNVFHDCAHWLALAHAVLQALHDVHSVGFFHLDIKADNLCIPVQPGFRVGGDAPLHADVASLKLIDYAFSVWERELPLPRERALGMAVSDEEPYQSRQLRAAIHAGYGGIAGLDWRADLYGLGWTLGTILPAVLAHPRATGWTPERRAQAQALVDRLVGYDLQWDRPAPPQPHRDLIAVLARTLGEPDLQSSLRAPGWRIAREHVEAGRGRQVPRTVPAPSLRAAGAPPAAKPPVVPQTRVASLADRSVPDPPARAGAPHGLWKVAGFAVVGVLAVAAGFYLPARLGGRDAPRQARPPAQSPQPVVAVPAQTRRVLVGHAGPLSGPRQYVGRDAENGVRMAIDDLNAERLVIGGQRIVFELLSVDDGADAAQAAEAARHLCRAGVVGVVSQLRLGQTSAAARVYDECGVPHIAVGPADPGLTRLGYRSTFRLVADTAQAAAAMARYAHDRLAVRRVAVLHDDSAEGAASAARFAAAARGEGLEIVDERPLPPRAADVRSRLLAVQARRPDAVFLGVDGRDDSDLLAQLQRLGPGTRLLGGADLCKAVDVHNATGASLAATVYCAESGIPLEWMKNGPAWKARYELKYPEQLRKLSPYSYDASFVFAEAMKRADSVDPKALLARLPQLSYAGMSGPISFDERGEPVHPAMTFYAYARGSKRMLPPSN